jgi:hypothetical protein
MEGEKSYRTEATEDTEICRGHCGFGARIDVVSARPRSVRKLTSSGRIVSLSAWTIERGLGAMKLYAATTLHRALA